MTLIELRSHVAALMNHPVNDFTVDDQDIFLVALNQARRQAELLHDFEFSRRLVTVSVNGVTGGSLSSAVEYGTTTPVDIKSIIEVGMFDGTGNLIPVEWTTVSEGLERQRLDNPRLMPRYPEDAWFVSTPMGQPRFHLSGDKVFRFPKDSEHDFTLGLEVYSFQRPWNWDEYVPYAEVEGPMDPDLSGTYGAIGTFGNYPLYYKTNCWLYRYGTSWTISQAFPNPGTNRWVQHVPGPTPVGYYDPYGPTFIGNPVVSIGGGVISGDYWLTYGHEFLLWATILNLNHRFKTFVFRQEGNLPPPEKLAQTAMDAFMEWDASRFEQNRRHGR